MKNYLKIDLGLTYTKLNDSEKINFILSNT